MPNRIILAILALTIGIAIILGLIVYFRPTTPYVSVAHPESATPQVASPTPIPSPSPEPTPEVIVTTTPDADANALSNRYYLALQQILNDLTSNPHSGFYAEPNYPAEQVVFYDNNNYYFVQPYGQAFMIINGQSEGQYGQLTNSYMISNLSGRLSFEGFSKDERRSSQVTSFADTLGTEYAYWTNGDYAIVLNASLGMAGSYFYIALITPDNFATAKNQQLPFLQSLDGHAIIEIVAQENNYALLDVNNIHYNSYSQVMKKVDGVWQKTNISGNDAPICSDVASDIPPSIISTCYDYHNCHAGNSSSLVDSQGRQLCLVNR